MNLLQIAQKYADSIPLRATIAKELLHYDILESLYDNPIGKKLVFQGGTALRLCYNNNRYSEDLDFVLDNGSIFELKDMEFFKDFFSRKIKNKYDLEVELDEPKDDTNLVKKYTAKILLDFNQGQKARINIEIAQIPSYDNHLIILNNNYPNEFNVNTIIKAESKKEILADKIIAIVARKHLKFRDFWDIKFLKDSNIKLDKELVKLKIKDYRIDDYKNKLLDKLSLIQNNNLKQEFEQEMIRFLEPKLFDFTKNSTLFDDIKNSVLELAQESLESNISMKDNTQTTQNHIQTNQNKIQSTSNNQNDKITRKR